MKTTNLFVVGLLALSLFLPGVLAQPNVVGGGVDIDIGTEDFAPRVWLCDSRVVYDDGTAPGRMSDDGDVLLERINNYAFEGEQVYWKVLVMDKNGIDKVDDVYVTIGDSQGEGNYIEANCGMDFELTSPEQIEESCNAQIGQADLEQVFQQDTAAYYDCTFTVETEDSMHGPHWVTVEAEDNDGLLGTMDENENWFFNPEIALSIEGDLTFEEVTPGTDSYSSTLLIGNEAEAGSGVLLDMFISGTDFYDSASSGARCPDTNQLSLEAFRYYAVSGAYSTAQDPRADAEGYVPIEFGTGFNVPTPFYDNNEIMQVPNIPGPYYPGNTLAPGSEHAVTFRLSLPEPCNGDFDSGQIFFWGEAI